MLCKVGQVTADDALGIQLRAVQDFIADDIMNHKTCLVIAEQKGDKSERMKDHSSEPQQAVDIHFLIW